MQINTCLRITKRCSHKKVAPFFICDTAKISWLMNPAPSLTVKKLLDFLQQLASFDLAESWDNVGLMAGDPNQEVGAILIGLDPTEELLDEAASVAANVIITHHPLIFRPLTSVRTDQPVGSHIAKALQLGISVIACHTNLDLVPGGVSDVLTRRLGLQQTSPLTEKAPGFGFGSLGTFEEPLAADIFLAKLFETLNVPTLGIAGPLPEQIKSVAVCGGSGSDLAEPAFNRGAQVFISGELKLSTARWAEASGFCIIDAGHYATENLIVPALAGMLEKRITDHGITCQVHTSTQQKNPFRYLVRDNGTVTCLE